MVPRNSVYVEAPKRQRHSTTIAACERGDTGNQISSLKLSSICKYARQAVRSRIQPRPSGDSPNTSQRFVRGASSICLVGESLMRSVPALWGCEGLRSYDYGHA